jgi:release factor glutamine methyltransferase
MPKTVSNIIDSATKALSKLSSSPKLDAQIILAHILNISRAKLFALDAKHTLKWWQLCRFNYYVTKRLKGYPVAYLIGQREFYGHLFKVGRGVLIPRPDSEVIIEELVKIYHKQHFSSLRDIGTGSGAIAISFFCATNGSVAVTASDISSSALSIFKHNNKTLANNKIAFKKVSLLNDASSYDVIVANLPYLTTAQTQLRSRWREPKLALDGGEDGLKLIKKLITQASGRCAVLMLEADPHQMEAIAKLLTNAGFKSSYTLTDLSGDNRVIVGLN